MAIVIAALTLLAVLGGLAGLALIGGLAAHTAAAEHNQALQRAVPATDNNLA